VVGLTPTGLYFDVGGAGGMAKRRAGQKGACTGGVYGVRVSRGPYSRIPSLVRLCLCRKRGAPAV
jgi:hypothetical protein